MANVIVMPKAGITVETCIMGDWEKRVGDKIEKDDIIFSYETDKSVFEYRAVDKDAGILLATMVQSGDDVPVLEPVCVVGEAGEDVSALLGGTAAEQTGTPATSAEEAPAAPTAVACTSPEEVNAVREDMFRISPRARKLAKDMDIRDISGIMGTGPMGRVIERDVRAYEKHPVACHSAEPMPAEEAESATVSVQEAVQYEDKKLSNIRKTIARNMQQSLSSMAQLTHTTSFDATAVLEYRKQLKKSAQELGLPGITVNDIIIYAVSRTILQYPDLNAHFLGDSIRYFKHANIGVAVDTPRGLMVPTIFDADQKSLAEISKEMKTLIAACQDGNISPDKLSGASFTISNLGTFGIESFTPIVNPPQTGILGINCTVDCARKGENGIELYPAMGLSLTYDHRAIDGAPASRFLQAICKSLENFAALLAK